MQPHLLTASLRVKLIFLYGGELKAVANGVHVVTDLCHQCLSTRRAVGPGFCNIIRRLFFLLETKKSNYNTKQLLNS